MAPNGVRVGLLGIGAIWVGEVGAIVPGEEVGWVSTELGRAGVENVGSLQADGVGNLHVALGGESLRYAFLDRAAGLDWEIEDVDQQGSPGRWNSIAVDSQGRPHISYVQALTKNLKYAIRDGATWQTEVVDVPGDVGKWNSIAIDIEGNPVIAYYDADNGDVKVARRGGGAWVIETVASEGNVGTSVSLAIDRNGREHLSWHDATWGNLNYAVRDGWGWGISDVDEVGGLTGLNSQMALDPDGRPVIAHYDALGEQITLARLGTDGVWISEPVATGVDLASVPARLRFGVAVKADGAVLVGVVDAVAYKRDGLWEMSELFEGGEGLNNSEIVMAIQCVGDVPFAVSDHLNSVYLSAAGIETSFTPWKKSVLLSSDAGDDHPDEWNAAMDSGGGMRIVYTSSDVIREIVKEGGVWSQHGVGGGRFPVIAIDGDDSHFLYQSDDAKLWFNASFIYQAGAGGTPEVIASRGYTSDLWFEAGVPQVALENGVDIDFYSKRSGEWSEPVRVISGTPGERSYTRPVGLRLSADGPTGIYATGQPETAGAGAFSVAGDGGQGEWQLHPAARLRLGAYPSFAQGDGRAYSIPTGGSNSLRFHTWVKGWELVDGYQPLVAANPDLIAMDVTADGEPRVVSAVEGDVGIQLKLFSAKPFEPWNNELITDEIEYFNVNSPLDAEVFVDGEDRVAVVLYQRSFSTGWALSVFSEAGAVAPPELRLVEVGDGHALQWLGRKGGVYSVETSADGEIWSTARGVREGDGMYQHFLIPMGADGALFRVASALVGG